MGMSNGEDLFTFRWFRCSYLQGETVQEDPEKNVQSTSETSATAYVSKRRNYKNDFYLQLSASRQKKIIPLNRVIYLVTLFVFSFVLSFFNLYLFLFVIYLFIYLFIFWIAIRISSVSAVYTTSVKLKFPLVYDTSSLLPISPTYFNAVRLGYYFYSLTILHTKYLLFSFHPQLCFLQLVFPLSLDPT